MRNDAFGEALNEGIWSVKAQQGRSIADIEDDIGEALGYSRATVQYWRKGHVPDSEDCIAGLARYVVQNGKRGRTWLDRFLRAARFYDRQRMLDELCPTPAVSWASDDIVHENLPARNGEFLGRQNDVVRVVEGLNSRWPLISIEGMGGIGKTTLAVEVGRACLSAGAANLDDPFEACVFISAKDREVVLNDLLETIARVLRYLYIIQQTPAEERPGEVERLLRMRRVLIIVDNFETVTDKALVDYLQRVPEPSKVLITTRYGPPRRVWDVPLQGLPETEALELVRRHATGLRLTAVAQANDETLKPLLDVTGGNPYALVTALGYLKRGNLALDTLVNSLHRVGREVEDIFQYIFERAWEILSLHSRHLLMVTPFFVESASKEALGATAGVDGYYLDAAIEQLVEMSLLEVNDALRQGSQRYHVHPLTLAFAQARLSEVPEWEQQAREQWSDFFVRFAEQYGDEDLGEPIGGGIVGHREKLRSEIKNLRAAIEWSFQHRPMKAVRLVERLTTFLLDEGEWAERLELCRRALGVAEAPESTAGLWTRLAWSYLVREEYEQARQAQQEGMAIIRSCLAQIQHERPLDADGSTWRDPQQQRLLKRLVQLLRDSGDLHSLEGDWAHAYRLYDESLALSRSLDYELGIAEAQAFAARTAYMQGRLPQTKQGLLNLLPVYRDRYPRTVLFALRFLGDIALDEGEAVQARAYLDEAADALRSYYEAHEEAQLYSVLGKLQLAQGDLHQAAAEYRKAIDLATRLGMQRELRDWTARLEDINRQREASNDELGE